MATIGRFRIIEALKGEREAFRVVDTADGNGRILRYVEAGSDVGAEVLERGEIEGKKYVVVADEPRSYDVSSPARTPNEPSSEPGEFTRMFQLPPQEAESERASEPGEFTRLFQAERVSKPEQEIEKTKPNAPSPLPSPGEFTRIFRPGVQRPGSSPPTGPVKPGNLGTPEQPSEFTKFFSSPLPGAGREPDWKALKEDPIAASPAARPPSDFTKMFGRATPTAPGAKAGDDLFQGRPTATPPTEADEFAKVFGSSKAAGQQAPKADAQVAASTGAAPPASAGPAGKKPPLVVLVVVIAALVITAVLAIYYFVVKR